MKHLKYFESTIEDKPVNSPIYTFFIKDDKLENFYKKIKKNNLNAAFYLTDNNTESIALVIMTPEQKKKIFPKIYGSNDNPMGAATIMTTRKNYDPESFIKDPKMYRATNKYHI